MSISLDERNRILLMIETGQITAQEAAQLLDALAVEVAPRTPEVKRERIIRIRVTSPRSGNAKTNFSASIPLQLLRIGTNLGRHLLPQLNQKIIAEIINSVEKGNVGRILDLHDLEQGERLEIFVE